MVIQPTQIETPEEKEVRREHSISESLIDDIPQVKGITCLRGMSPLVMTALQRSNNPYVTGRPGFEEAGVNIGDDGKVTDFAAFGIAMMPKTAAVLVLWTCDRPTLKMFATSPEFLENAALDYMEDFPGGIQGLAEVTIHVSKALEAIQLSKAVPAEDEDSPKASTIETESGLPSPK